MILEKVFEISLNVSNPINFCIDKYNHVMTELTNIYLNKCYLGTYITAITDILQISSCKIVNTNSSASGTIDVKFLATVYVLNQWDILVGIRIEKNQSLVVGKYKTKELEIDVAFNPTHIQTNLLNIGQLIPIRVIMAYHKPRENKIAVAALLLTCEKKIVNYRVKGELPKLSLPEIQMLLNNIQQELKLRSTLDSTKVKFFESLVYSYKKFPSDTSKIECLDTYWEGPIIKNYFNIFNAISTDLTGFWTRPLNLCRSSPLLTVTQDKPTEYILTSPHLMIIEFAKNILTFLVAIRECVELYSDELISSHQNIWTLMRNAQLE